MKYILLIIATVCVSLQNILKKQYNTKSRLPDGFLFSGITSLFACLFFIVNSGFSLSFEIAVIPYSIYFAIAFASAIIGSFLAIKYGSLSITQLITSYSLMIPTVYGIVFLDEKMRLLSVIGFIAVLVSVFLISGKNEKVRITPKAALYLTIAFIGNGMCSTVQKMQQLKFSGGYKNEFMIIALLICAICFIAIFFFECKNKKEEFKIAFIPSALAGICNGAVNYLVMVLTALMPASLLFPSISAGGIAIGFFVSLFVYKERLGAKQTAGYFLGILSVVLLNL